MGRKTCGYCKYHKMYMSVQNIKRKGCLMKENIGNTCKHLVKLEHPWWVQKEVIKKKKNKER